MSNEHRKSLPKKKKKDAILTKAFTFLPDTNMIPAYRHVDNLKLYYNFFNNKKNEFCSNVFSDLTNSRIIKYKDSLNLLPNSPRLLLEENPELDFDVTF
jgi:hypothetical protein